VECVSTNNSNADLSEWTPLNVPITLRNDGMALCGMLPRPLPSSLPTLFPIQRYTRPSNTH
jgi:hypothetical protein